MGHLVDPQPSTEQRIEEGEIVTSFLSNLGNEIIRGEILRRIFETHNPSYELLGFLCILRLVCRAWKQWINAGFEWTVVNKLY
jgi:hypothetical protein